MSGVAIGVGQIAASAALALSANASSPRAHSVMEWVRARLHTAVFDNNVVELRKALEEGVGVNAVDDESSW